ncbi:MAG: hypothetical protein Q8O66_03355, partial [bacterium]|nr:hypothetical protein [bacterium]
RFSEKIDNCLWLNNNYIIFTINGKIKISETDNKNNLNIFTLPEKLNLSDGTTIDFANKEKSPEIYFNQQDKKLYILTEDTLLSSERIAP